MAMQLAGKYYFATPSACIEFVDKASAITSTTRPNRTHDELCLLPLVKFFSVSTNIRDDVALNFL